MALTPSNDFEKYHAHVYFDEQSADQAHELCAQAWKSCHVGLGRFHRKAVGPHPLWSCQLSFDKDEFERIITLGQSEGSFDQAPAARSLAVALVAQFPEYYRWHSQREFTHNGIRQQNLRRTLGIGSFPLQLGLYDVRRQFSLRSH